MNAQAQIAAHTTLNTIRAKSPCRDGWNKLLAHLGKTSADDDILPLLTVLDSNGIDDALWVLQHTECDNRLSRHFGAWCVEQVLHLFEVERPDDNRPRLAIAAARDDSLTDAASAAARAAARAAAWAAAREAASAAASAAANAAAWAAASAAAWAAASAAASAAANAAAWAAASAAAWAAARDAAWAAARDAQSVHLRKMLTEGF